MLSACEIQVSSLKAFRRGLYRIKEKCL